LKCLYHFFALKLSRYLTGFILQLLFLPAAGLAEEQVSIAVMEFNSKGGVTQKQMDALSDMLANEIRQLGDYRVIGKSDISSVLRLEEQKRLVGCTDESCIAEIGGALGVRWVVVGNISKFGQAFLLNLKLIDVERIQVAAGFSEKIKGGEEDLIDALPNAVKDIFTKARLKMHPGSKILEPTPEPIPQPTPKKPPVDVKVSLAANPYNTWGHVTFWSGTGLLIFGGASMAMALNTSDAYSKGNESAWDTTKTWTGLMWTGLGLGAALMTTGIILWTLEPDQEPARLGGSLAPAADGSGLVFSIGGKW